MKKPTDIADYKPHLVLTGIDGNQHVFPQSLVTNWIEGKRDLPSADGEPGARVIMKSILADWLRIIGDPNE